MELDSRCTSEQIIGQTLARGLCGLLRPDIWAARQRRPTDKLEAAFAAPGNIRVSEAPAEPIPREKAPQELRPTGIT
jgi:hypothetical protein